MVKRHVWEKYMETVEDILHIRGNREIYFKIFIKSIDINVKIIVYCFYE